MTAPAYVATDWDVASFTAAGLPVLTPTPQLVTDQTTLTALLTAAGKNGVRLRFSSSGTPSTAPTARPVLSVDGMLADANGKVRPRIRTRRLLHEQTVNAEVTAFAAGAAALGGATQSIAFATSGGTPTLIAANYALCDWGQAQSQTPYVWNSGGFGYVYHKEPWQFQQGKTIRFFTDSKYVSTVGFFGLSGYGKVWVDGQPAAATNNIAWGGSNAGVIFLNLTFGTNKARLIEIKTDNWLGSLAVEPTAQVWAPEPLQGPRILVVGDSFNQGFYATGMYGAYQMLDDLTGFPNIAIDGQGGSGPNANGSYYSTGLDGAGSYNNPVRLANHVAWKPDVILVGGALNDLNAATQRTVAQIEADMVAQHTSYRAALPNALLVQMKTILTPVFKTAKSGSIPGMVNTIDADLDAGLLNSLGVRIMPKASGWLSGLGNTGAPASDGGNSDRYVYTDGGHPNDAGHQFLARHIAEALQTIMET